MKTWFSLIQSVKTYMKSKGNIIEWGEILLPHHIIMIQRITVSIKHVTEHD